jgi:hypothetical protein
VKVPDISTSGVDGMLKELVADVKEVLKEMATLDFVKPQAQVIGMVALFGLVAGGCTAWVYKDRHEELTSLKAMALVSAKQKPLKAISKNKASQPSKCSFVSEKPIATFKVSSEKGLDKRALLVMGQSTATEPVIYIRNLKNPGQYHCMEGFNEKRGSYNKLTEMVYLENGAYEVYIGTQRKGEWTKQKIEIFAM